MDSRSGAARAADNSAANGDATGRWNDPKVAAQLLLSPSVLFLVDSLAISLGRLAESRRVLENTTESASAVAMRASANRWSDPKVAAQLLLSPSVPFLEDSLPINLGHSAQSSRTLENTTESASAAATPASANRWSDPKVAAQLLLSPSVFSRIGQAESEPARAAGETPPGIAELLEGGTFDSSKHPRGGNSRNSGQFSQAPGASASVKPQMVMPPHDSKKPLRVLGSPHAAGSGKGAAGGRPTNPSNPSHWHLPSEAKGTWLGEPGKSTFRLKKPINVNGRIIKDIQYVGGVPVLDKYSLPGKTVTIVLTGDNNIDRANARKAWEKLNLGKEFPGRAVFHHDLLHVAEETVTIDGKKTKVLVGKMQLIPKSMNEVVHHEGSASVARKFYRGLGTDTDAVKRLASKEASLAGKAGGFVATATKKIKAGKIAKGLLPFVGRNVVRAIPIATTGLAILEFSDNVEAHGVGGAVARAVPVLGDLISAHDLGSDLANQINEEAIAAMDANAAAINTPVAEAWKQANEQTIEAFDELAKEIPVTNPYGPNGLVDPQDIADALKLYRGAMQQANLLRARGASGSDFAAAAARAKQELKDRLTRACQKNAPQARGPAL